MFIWGILVLIKWCLLYTKKCLNNFNFYHEFLYINQNGVKHRLFIVAIIISICCLLLSLEHSFILHTSYQLLFKSCMTLKQLENKDINCREF